MVRGCGIATRARSTLVGTSACLRLAGFRSPGLPFRSSSRVLTRLVLVLSKLLEHFRWTRLDLARRAVHRLLQILAPKVAARAGFRALTLLQMAMIFVLCVISLWILLPIRRMVRRRRSSLERLFLTFAGTAGIR